MLAETLVRSLPWYFGVAVFALWGGAASAMFVLLRRRIKARADRSHRANRSRRANRSQPADRPIGQGTDVEPW